LHSATLRTRGRHNTSVGAPRGVHADEFTSGAVVVPSPHRAATLDTAYAGCVEHALEGEILVG
jgi:hypothetical protein